MYTTLWSSCSKLSPLRFLCFHLIFCNGWSFFYIFFYTLNVSSEIPHLIQSYFPHTLKLPSKFLPYFRVSFKNSLTLWCFPGPCALRCTRHEPVAFQNVCLIAREYSHVSHPTKTRHTDCSVSRRRGHWTLHLWERRLYQFLIPDESRCITAGRRTCSTIGKKNSATWRNNKTLIRVGVEGHSKSVTHLE